MLGLRVGFGLRLGLRFRLIVTISVSLGSLLVVTTCLLFWVFWCDAAFILPMSIVKKNVVGRMLHHWPIAWSMGLGVTTDPQKLKFKFKLNCTELLSCADI